MAYKFEIGNGDINIKCSLERGIGVFFGNSGLGKTLTFNLIDSYCTSNNIPYVHFNSNGLSFGRNAIIEACRGKKIVIFDNADLYLDTDLLNSIKDFGIDYILVSIKVLSKISGVSNMFNYNIKVSESNKELLVERIL